MVLEQLGDKFLILACTIDVCSVPKCTSTRYLEPCYVNTIVYDVSDTVSQERVPILVSFPSPLRAHSLGSYLIHSIGRELIISDYLSRNMVENYLTMHPRPNGCTYGPFLPNCRCSSTIFIPFDICEESEECSCKGTFAFVFLV